MEGVSIILRDCLGLISNYAASSFVFAILLSVSYLYVKQNGVKNTIQEIWNKLKNESLFRKRFVFAFLCYMICERTILGRTQWVYPLTNPLGSWTAFNENGEFNFDIFENIVMFIPYIGFLPYVFPNQYETDSGLNCIKRLFTISLVTSVTIEFLQLFLRLGKFQLSDIFFNCVGGVIGAFLWLAIRFVKQRKGNK